MVPIPFNFTIVAGPDTFGTVRNGGHMRDGMVVTFTVGTQNAQTGEWSA